MVKVIFEEIGKILDGNMRAVNYTITGYKYVETRLVLHFQDCDQVFDFMDVDGTIMVEKFFTKDFDSFDEYQARQSEFRMLHKSAQPEKKLAKD